MKLIITEKPSVAQSISLVLGAKSRKDGYLEGGGYIVSWCLGHLFELARAESYNEKYTKWKHEDLPIIPAKWQFVISKDKEERFAVLRELMHRNDVTEVINACDAGREGELIFRTVYYMADCTKIMKRLWISSMEDEAIKKGFANLQPGSNYDGLYSAALCRAKADWLVGINATRLFSTVYHRTLNVGRVLSPTLAMLVERESAISNFKPKNFYTVNVTSNGMTAVSERFEDMTEAAKLADLCRNSPVTVKSIERKEKSEKAPLLYDLTALQRDANRILGYTAQQTLDYLQSLYEKKLCTYPRTDSRYLTEDMQKSVPEIVKIASKLYNMAVPENIHPEQVCDSSKVTDHHAIILTSSVASADISVLPNGEREILMLTAKRLFEAISESYRYAETVVTLDCDGKSLTAKGKTVLETGWKFENTEDKSLPELAEGDVIDISEVAVKDGKTTPPKHFTEDTLLAAMENGSRFCSQSDFVGIDDRPLVLLDKTPLPSAGKEDMPDGAERKGIGTPATRAGILEKLVSTGFVKREKTSLVPENSGNSLVAVLPENLKLPLLTAEWEQKLKGVEKGEISPDDFMSGISEMLVQIVKNYEPVKNSEVLFPTDRDVIGKCPRCGGEVTESKLGFFCERSDCRFGLWKDNKFFSSKHAALNKKAAAALLANGRVHMNKLYSEKTGKEYEADVVLVDTGEAIRFKLEFDNNNKKEGI